jgi:hypothetical protein
MTIRIAVLVTAVSLVLCLAAGVQAQSLPRTFFAAVPVVSPQAAVAEAVQTDGTAYAGDCLTTTPADFGADCSKYMASEGAVQAYAIGPVFSEFTDWVFVGQTASGWIPVGSAGFDDGAGEPVVPWPAG